MFVVSKLHAYPHLHTHLLDVFEGDFLALSGCHGEDVHLQRSQSERSIVLQLWAEPLQDHIVAALRAKQEAKSHKDPRVSFWACEAHFTSPLSNSSSSASPLSSNKLFSTSVGLRFHQTDTVSSPR